MNFDIAIIGGGPAGNTSYISMLPKVPFPLILYRVNIIMGNPVRVCIEDGIVQITGISFPNNLSLLSFVIIVLLLKKIRL